LGKTGSFLLDGRSAIRNGLPTNVVSRVNAAIAAAGRDAEANRIPANARPFPGLRVAGGLGGAWGSGLPGC
jgi:hypothetical protein